MAFVLVNALGYLVLSGSLPPGVSHAAETEWWEDCFEDRRFATILEEYQYYPPLYPFFIFIFSLHFGSPFIAKVLYSDLFFIMALISLYRSGRILGGPVTGLTACSVFCAYPLVNSYTKSLTFECALVGLVAVSLELLLAGGAFDKKSHAILLGLTGGFALLVKWSYAFYVVGPVGIRLVQATFQKSMPEDEAYLGAALSPRAWRWGNAFRAAGTAALICGPWYLFLFEPDALSATAGNDPTLSEYSYGAALAFYWGLRYQAMTHTLALVTCVAALALILGRRGYGAAMVGGAVLVPIGILASFVHMEVRYLLPLMPALALVTASGLQEIARGIRGATAAVSGRPVDARPVLMFFFLLVAIASGLYHTYYRAIVPMKKMLGPGDLTLTDNRGRLHWIPVPGEKFASALRPIFRELARPGRKLQVATHPYNSIRAITPAVFAYLRHRHKEAFEGTLYAGFDWASMAAFRDAVMQGSLDVVLVSDDFFEIPDSSYGDVNRRADMYRDQNLTAIRGRYEQRRSAPRADPALKRPLENRYARGPVIDLGKGGKVLVLLARLGEPSSRSEAATREATGEATGASALPDRAGVRHPGGSRPPSWYAGLRPARVRAGGPRASDSFALAQASPARSSLDHPADPRPDRAGEELR